MKKPKVKLAPVVIVNGRTDDLAGGLGYAVSVSSVCPCCYGMVLGSRVFWSSSSRRILLECTACERAYYVEAAPGSFPTRYWGRPHWQPERVPSSLV